MSDILLMSSCRGNALHSALVLVSPRLGVKLWHKESCCWQVLPSIDAEEYREGYHRCTLFGSKA